MSCTSTSQWQLGQMNMDLDSCSYSCMREWSLIHLFLVPTRVCSQTASWSVLAIFAGISCATNTHTQTDRASHQDICSNNPHLGLVLMMQFTSSTVIWNCINADGGKLRASTAPWIIKSSVLYCLITAWPICQLQVADDRSICPDIQWCYRLYYKSRQMRSAGSHSSVYTKQRVNDVEQSLCRCVNDWRVRIRQSPQLLIPVIERLACESQQVNIIRSWVQCAQFWPLAPTVCARPRFCLGHKTTIKCRLFIILACWCSVRWTICPQEPVPAWCYSHCALIHVYLQICVCV